MFQKNVEKWVDTNEEVLERLEKRELYERMLGRLLRDIMEGKKRKR